MNSIKTDIPESLLVIPPYESKKQNKRENNNIPDVDSLTEEQKEVYNQIIKYLNGELKDTTTAYAKIRDFQDLYRNRQLVTLPYPGMPLLKVSKQGQLPLLRFLDLCRDYGFESFVRRENLDQWKKYLKLV